MALQAQVLAVVGQTGEAEQITSRIVSEEPGCLECYRLLSAIYSRQERPDKVRDRRELPDQARGRQGRWERQDEGGGPPGGEGRT